MLPEAHYLRQELQKAKGLTISIEQDTSKAKIDLKLITSRTAAVAGSYILDIAANHITISSSTNEGIFYGIVSLLQLVKNQPDNKNVSIQSVQITDAPRYQWRGFMLDESRHFFGKAKVEQLLDWMAYYKLNRFHWHLTDVNGWRIEIKKYPNLTTVGGVGNYSDSLSAAKYYTQDDIKEIVAYARERFITVIPEIDMPGHATAANRAYPEFSGGSVPLYPNFTFDPSNEKTYQFLADILKETRSLFPSGMIHLGGDEVALGIRAWAKNPAIKDMMTKNNFTSLTELEHYFFKRMADTVTSLNSKLLCWDEATQTNLPADKTIIFWWRQNIHSQLSLALYKKYQVVLCPRLPLYFDFVQNKDHVSGRNWNGRINSIDQVYNFPDKQMSADELKSNQILGIQANLWTETVGSEKRLDFMVFPRLAGLAESAWTDAAFKNEESFNARLITQFALYDKAGIYYYNPFDVSLHPEPVDFAPRVYIHHTRNGRRHKHHHGRSHQRKKTSHNGKRGAKHRRTSHVKRHR